MVRRSRVFVGAVAAAALLGGCTVPFTKAQAVRPRPTPSPSAQATRTLPTDPSPSTSPATCRIAVAGNQPGSGGFVTVPGGDFTPDSKSDVKLPNADPNGYGNGALGLSFDFAAGKWLPVRRTYVAPNGLSYAYGSFDADGGFYVIDATSGKVREIAKGSTFLIVEWRDAGIYAMRNDPLPSGARIFHGLYLVNPDTGQVRQLTSRGNWSVIGPLAAWGYDYADQNQPDTSHTLLRYDLVSGGVVSYFTAAGSSPTVIGFDEQDRPIVNSINDVAQQISIMLGVNQAYQISSGPGYQSTQTMNFNGQAVSDGRGMWIGTNHGLMLYTTAYGFTKVSDTTGQVAGRCH